MAQMRAENQTDPKEVKQGKRRVNADFFRVGKQSDASDTLPIDDDEENKDWRNIKPNQNVDALNKEVFKKRKYEEFRKRNEQVKDGA